MKFRQFFLLTEADPLGGAGDAPGMGGPPLGLGGPPGMGGPPPGLGGPPGMGGPPPGLGGPPGMGGAPGGSETPVIPKHADVWDVLDHILNKKPLEHDEKLKNQESKPEQSLMGQPPQMPQGAGSGPALMS